MGGNTEIGRYACIVPCDFAEPPPIEGDPGCLLLFVSAEQASGVQTGPIVTVAPPSQDKAGMRLGHVVWKIGTDLPPLAIVGLVDPNEPIADAVARAGADTLNPATYPILATPLWAITPADRAIIAARLPVLP